MNTGSLQLCDLFILIKSNSREYWEFKQHKKAHLKLAEFWMKSGAVWRAAQIASQYHLS